MGKVKFTKQQQQAINERNKNILVSAAAGSGKTAVLVQRILSIIKEQNNNINIDNFLVVTFTRAAADEMREKIYNAINKELEKTPTNKKLANQLLLINKAYISTIDSFCLSIVKQNFHKTQLDPNFTIHSNDEIKYLSHQVMEELFEEKYSTADKDFLYLVEYFCNGSSINNFNKLDDFKLKEHISNIHSFACANPNPQEWLNKSIQAYSIENKSLYDTVWGDILVKSIKPKIKALELSINLFLQAAATPECSQEKKIKEFVEYYNDLIHSIKNSFSLSLQDFIEYIKNDMPKAPQLRLSKNTIITDETKEMLSDIKADISGILKDFVIFTAVEDTYKAEINALKPVVTALIQLVKEFSQRLWDKKINEQVFEYNDIAHLTIDILTDEAGKPSNTAKNLQDMFYEIIVDEYQDNNYIQEAILTAVSKESRGINNRFMVGDIKQSIYKFRQATPEIFIDKYEAYNQTDTNFLIALNKNFRSRSCILDFTNYIFKQTMTKTFGDLNYDESVELKYGADYPQATENIAEKVELALFNKIQGSEAEIDNSLIEAEYVASKINEIVNGENPLYIFNSDTKSYRPAQYSDIVILFRSDSTITPTYLEVLANHNIPASSPKGSNLFDTIEVKTLCSMLKIIDNPLQDIELLTVMHCPAYNFSVDEIAEIKGKTREHSFYATILKYLNENNNSLCEKLSNFLKDLETLQKEKNLIPVSLLIDKVLNVTDYGSYVQALSNGIKRRENIKKLKEIALSMESKGSCSLFDYLEWLKEYTLGSNKIKEAIPSTENNVRIMSIHASKGLEFPIVFIPQLEKKFKDNNNELLIHSSYPIAPKYIDLKTRTQAKTFPYNSLKTIINMEDSSEELRILYVGLTRAKEMLYLSGTLNENFYNYDRFYNLNLASFGNFYSSIKTKSFLKIILNALLRNKGIAKELSSKEPFGNSEINDYALSCKAKIMEPDMFLEHTVRNIILNSDLINKLEAIDINQEVSKEISDNLSWSYHNRDLMNLASKLSISEIKKAGYVDDFGQNLYETIEFSAPEFMSDSKEVLSAANRGTAYHSLMEFLDFNFTTQEQIIDLKQRLINNNLLTQKEAESIDNSKILKFLSSPLNQKLKYSEKIYREQPFVMGMSPYEIYKEEKYKNSNSTILVNGIIDLFFQDEKGDIILVDYKTDYVKNGNYEAIMDRYKIQIELYKKAIELNTGKNVAECYLYLFGIDKEVKYNF